MRQPTPEQLAVLTNSERVRIVRAAPGSGKTWLVAELMHQELEKWPLKTSGIAALSFTRVGGDEIRKAVGHELGHPHFVGTIDSFLFRYVIRPFLCRCFPAITNPRLIPGTWGAEHWCNYGHAQKATVGKSGINLFGCVCIGEDNGSPVVAHKPHPAQPLRHLSGDELSQVRDAKKKIWQQTGRLTHSDAAFWAYKVLGHRTFGPMVRAEIVRRFPLLIVDELQDTGYFLGKSIALLLGEAAVRGVLVGDPDQAIYEFNGARPDLFDDYERIDGAVSLSLANSLRCAPAIATAAGFLKDSGGTIGPAQGKPGRAFLVRYSDMTKNVSQVLDAIVTKNYETLKVISRLTSTVEALIRRSAKPAPKLGSPPLTHINRAVTLFRQGHQVRALAAVRAALELAVFDYEGLNDEQLTESKIDPLEWKTLAVQCLMCANGIPVTGTLYDWLTEVGNNIDDELTKFGLEKSLPYTTGKLKPKKLPGWDKKSENFLPQSGTNEPILAEIPVQTVHSVKGETHDVSIFVCPDVRNVNRCPSLVWWSPDEKDREERRIAYVAMTRTRGDLIVCVSDACYQRLVNDRSEFVASFECLTVDEFITDYASDRVRGATNKNSEPGVL